MPISHSMDHSVGFVRGVWTGRVTAQELAAAWTRMFSSPEILAAGRSLTDTRGAEIGFTSEELREVVVRVGMPLLAGRVWRNALLVDRPMHFGVARQFSVFTEAVATVQVFYEESEAIRWLQAQPV